MDLHDRIRIGSAGVTQDACRSRRMRNPSNELLADKLREMADILEVQHEDGYRIAAYRRAARTILELERPSTRSSAMRASKA